MRLISVAIPMIVGVILFIPLFSSASESAAPGVNPKDNITKMEVLYRYESYDDEAFMHILPVKYDMAFNKNWGGNVELPFISYNGNGLDEDGIGDLAVRGRYLLTKGKITFISGAEIIFLTGSDDALGAGKWQVNPSGGLVYQFTERLFAFAGYKHIFSVAGDDDRADLNQSQPRLLLAKITPKGQCFLSDAKYTKSWKDRKDHILDLEGEVGTMIGASTGIFFRGGTSILDSARP